MPDTSACLNKVSPSTTIGDLRNAAGNYLKEIHNCPATFPLGDLWLGDTFLEDINKTLAQYGGVEGSTIRTRVKWYGCVMP